MKKYILIIASMVCAAMPLSCYDIMAWRQKLGMPMQEQEKKKKKWWLHPLSISAAAIASLGALWAIGYAVQSKRTLEENNSYPVNTTEVPAPLATEVPAPLATEVPASLATEVPASLADRNLFSVLASFLKNNNGSYPSTTLSQQRQKAPVDLKEFNISPEDLQAAIMATEQYERAQSNQGGSFHQWFIGLPPDDQKKVQEDQEKHTVIKEKIAKAKSENDTNIRYATRS